MVSHIVAALPTFLHMKALYEFIPRDMFLVAALLCFYGTLFAGVMLVILSTLRLLVSL